MSLSQHAQDFIDDSQISSLLGGSVDRGRFDEVIAKSLAKEPLTAEECAVLINASAPDQVERIFEAARELKQRVYGNRIVLFAPLYVGNLCINDCGYCGFRRSNRDAVRRTLTPSELQAQVEALEDAGHKRLILVFGEHRTYSAEFIAEAVRLTYGTRKGHGEIRRVNINAAPLTYEEYKTVKAAGIGTYQVFQETYHHGAYCGQHPQGTRKADYLWRLDALSRAMEAGIDDVGIGALFGLCDWRFDALGLVTHARFLKETYGVGPHTISFPRLQPASGVTLDPRWSVSDDDFKRLVAILRLSVPYTGMIMTCRESAEMRRAAMSFGVSQIDAGTRLELGGYTERTSGDQQALSREQFALGDTRSLDEVARELMEEGHLPSFCTACYRLGRTGEVFMEYAIPGFIEKCCTPNALTTLQEYLVDYASPETRAVGQKLLDRELSHYGANGTREKIRESLRLIRETNTRDVYQ
ncbi:MAG TPA: [FeFe] hydrogenase H-cluster radical SAM maturase HydG [Armatimonadota bacterium]|jgi:2-iminoacetate synthase